MKNNQHRDNVLAIRLNEGLRDALGPDIADLLAEEFVTDVLVNADGRVWVIRTGEGRAFSGIVMSPENADFALRMLASHAGIVLTREKPLLSAELPVTGERVAGTIWPITDRPTFAIRVPPRNTFDISDYPLASDVATDGLAADSSDQLFTLMNEGRNILIAGATGSGKTSFMSALMKTDMVRRDRCVVIEDTREIAIASEDHVRFISSPEVSTGRLVQHSLRYQPDRIIIGEIRSGEVALELTNACNTGHGGSFATIHANNALSALIRLESLLAQVGHVSPQRDVAAAIGGVVFLRRRTIAEIISVEGWDAGAGAYITRRL